MVSIRWARGTASAYRPSLYKATTCPFSYSGPLTEANILGIVAYRTGKKIDWDAKLMKARGCPEAEAFIRKTYRKSWTL